MASKEIYLARYYVDREKWIPAIKIQKSCKWLWYYNICWGSLHRLVELHYKIGLVNEAEKYALLLGYNYRLVSGMKHHIKYSIEIIRKEAKG